MANNYCTNYLQWSRSLAVPPTNHLLLRSFSCSAATIVSLCAFYVLRAIFSCRSVACAPFKGSWGWAPPANNAATCADPLNCRRFVNINKASDRNPLLFIWSPEICCGLRPMCVAARVDWKNSYNLSIAFTLSLVIRSSSQLQLPARLRWISADRHGDRRRWGQTIKSHIARDVSLTNTEGSQGAEKVGDLQIQSDVLLSRARWRAFSLKCYDDFSGDGERTDEQISHCQQY